MYPDNIKFVPNKFKKKNIYPKLHFYFECLYSSEEKKYPQSKKYFNQINYLSMAGNL